MRHEKSKLTAGCFIYFYTSLGLLTLFFLEMKCGSFSYFKILDEEV